MTNGQNWARDRNVDSRLENCAETSEKRRDSAQPRVVHFTRLLQGRT
jgi:hypothetical protein